MNGTATALQVTLNDLLSLGWSLIPVRADKRPLIPRWKQFQERKPSESEIAEWLRMTPFAWAVITGAISGIVTLDMDGAAGIATMERLQLRPHRRTGGGGFHIDFKHPGWPVRTVNGKTAKSLAGRWPGLDVRADGGYAIALGRSAKGDYKWQREADGEVALKLGDSEAVTAGATVLIADVGVRCGHQPNGRGVVQSEPVDGGPGTRKAPLVP